MPNEVHRAAVMRAAVRAARSPEGLNAVRILRREGAAAAAAAAEGGLHAQRILAARAARA